MLKRRCCCCARFRCCQRHRRARGRERVGGRLRHLQCLCHVRCAGVQVESVEAAAELLPDVTLSTVRRVSSVSHCILEWVLALHGYYWAHRAMAPLIDATALLKELTHDFASQCDVKAT